MMGAYLSEPITDKESADEENEFLLCGSSSMQGWRMTQEDAHNTELDYDRNASLFAVYDGHGGSEVAQYCAQNLPLFIRMHEEYKKGNYDSALQQAFLEFDATLIQESVGAVLKEMSKQVTSESTEDEDNLEELRQEGHMPLEELIERYREIQRNAALAANEASHVPNGLSNGHSSGESSSSKVDGEASVAAAPAAGSADSKSNVDDTSAPAASASAEPATNGEASKSPNTTVSASSLNGESPGSSSASPAAKSTTKDSSTLNQNDKVDSSSDDEDESYKHTNGSNAGSDDDDDDAISDKTGSEKTGSDAISDKTGSDAPVSDDDDDDDDDVYPEAGEDDGFLSTMNEAPGYSSGCTAVVALLIDRELYVANAGDSRCVVCRDGEALEMSLDHKPEDDEESERIKNAGGRVTMDGRVNGGLNLSRAIGDHGYKRNAELKPEEQMISAKPDVRHVSLLPTDDFMILACDGIWNYMSNEEVVQFVKERLEQGRDKLSTICEELFTHCLADNTMGDGTGCDNMTAVLIKFKPSFHQKSSKRCASPETDIAETTADTAKRIKTDNEPPAAADSTTQNDSAASTSSAAADSVASASK